MARHCFKSLVSSIIINNKLEAVNLGIKIYHTTLLHKIQFMRGILWNSSNVIYCLLNITQCVSHFRGGHLYHCRHIGHFLGGPTAIAVTVTVTSPVPKSLPSSGVISAVHSFMAALSSSVSSVASVAPDTLLTSQVSCCFWVGLCWPTVGCVQQILYPVLQSWSWAFLHIWWGLAASSLAFQTGPQ